MPTATQHNEHSQQPPKRHGIRLARPHIPSPVRRRLRGDDRGQATSEYGLVILVAAGIAFGVIAWAGGTDAFTDLFDQIVEHLTSDL